MAYLSICYVSTCRDEPLCEPSDVTYLPDRASVERMEKYLELATAQSIVTNVPAMAACKGLIKWVIFARYVKP